MAKGEPGSQAVAECGDVSGGTRKEGRRLSAKSQALEDYWQRPITAEQLQAEMDRMANHTKQPDVLRELFQSLGNDPFIIAECLARPMLAERLFTSRWLTVMRSYSVSERTRSRTNDSRSQVTLFRR